MKDDRDLVAECWCGGIWRLDYAPTPKGCNDHPWRLGLTEWGIWLDKEGNPVEGLD